MPKQITYEKLTSPDAFSRLIADIEKAGKSFNDMNKEITKAKENIRNLAKGLSTELKGTDITGKGIGQLSGITSQTEGLKNSYQKLTIQQREYLRLQNQLATASAKLTTMKSDEYKQLIRIQAEQRKYNQQIKEELGLTKQRTGLFKGFIGQLKGLALAYLSVHSAIGLVRNIFTTTKELDKLSLSFKTLIKDSNDLATAQAFLADISGRFGLDIIKTSDQYLKFSVSANLAGLAQSKTNKIFESFAKVGSIMGKSASDMELIFLALEQMLNKNRVQTEELRKQLGDKLPGSVAIMAKAYGRLIGDTKLTTKELDNFMKKGLVISSEVLPLFAEELEKAAGTENIKRIDTLQASSERLKNTWIGVVDAIGGSRFFINILNSFSESLQKVFPQYFKEQQALVISNKLLEEYKTKLIEITKAQDALTAKNKIKDYLEEIQNQMDDTNNELDQLRLDLKTVTPSSFQFKNMENEIKALESRKEALRKVAEELRKILFDPESIYKLLKKDLDELNKSADDQLKNLQDQLNAATGIIEKLQAEIALKQYLATKSTNISTLKGLNLEIESLKGILKFYQDIGKEKEKQDFKELKVDDNITDEILKGFEKNSDEINKIIEDDIQEQGRYFEYVGDLINKYNIGVSEFEQSLKEIDILVSELNISSGQATSMRIKAWLDANDKIIDALKDFQSQLFEIFDNIAKRQVDVAEQEVKLRENNVDNLRQKLDDELKAKEDGDANDVYRIEAKIAKEKALLEKANDELEKAQKRQALIQAAAQTSDILTGVASIFKDGAKAGIWGWIAAAASVAAMIATWQNAINEVKSINKYAEGEVDIRGKKHSQGGIQVEIEDHESVIKGSSTLKSKKLLNAINEGKLTDALWALNFEPDLSRSNYQQYSGVNELIKEYRQQKNYLKKIAEKNDIIPMEGYLLFIKDNGDKIVKRKIRGN